MVTGFNHFINRISILFGSIRFRLAVWFGLILGVLVIIFSAFIYTLQVQDHRAAAIDRLERKALRLRGFLRFSNQAYFQQTPLRFPNDPNNGESLLQEGDVLVFLNPSGQIIQSWGPLNSNSVHQVFDAALTQNEKDVPFSHVELSNVATGENTRTDYAMVAGSIISDGSMVGSFLLGTPVDPGNQLPRLLISLILGVLLIPAAALAGGVWLAGRAMHPVKAITQAAQTISETDLSLRLHIERKDELGELANTFDNMLARLQAAFERQRQFTADASHELRTPLTIMELEASRALAAPRAPEEYQHALKLIQTENQFMIRMVNNLLTLARMDAGQVVLQKQELDLSDVALEVVERLAWIASKNQVRLSTGELPELLILGDRQYLAQMLSNLVENAIKYSTGEEQRVHVETGSRSSESGLLAWVRVSDNGPGISPEHLPHLFDRFYQVDKARTRLSSDDEDGGDQAASRAGLGLAIVKWIVDAHGGEVRVQSELGKGSIFEVSFAMVASISASTKAE